MVNVSGSNQRIEKSGEIHSSKLNILALPPYTAVFFALIALVILGAAFASLLPYSQLWWPLIVLPITLLPLRDFLHWPDREKARHRFRLPTPAEASIQQAIDELSEKAGIHPPQALINQDHRSLYAFGTFRRHFISVGENMAGVLAQELADEDVRTKETARALLAHELAHIVNGDMRRAALARSLLKIALWTALVSMWVAATFVSILVEIGPEITTPSFWTAAAATTDIPGLSLQWVPRMMQAENPHVFELLAHPEQAGQFWNYAIFYLLNIFIPFLFTIPVLYLLFWRKMMRVREFYADQRAATWIGDSQRVADAILLHDALSAASPNTASSRRFSLRRIFVFLPKTSWLSYHPSREERRQALRSPLLIFGSPWKIALWTGIAVLLLEIILRSSLTLIYIAQPAPYLPLLTATIVFSIWLLPHIYAGESFENLLKTAVKMAAIFILVKLSLNFLDAFFLGLFVLFGRLDVIGAMLDAYLRGMLGGLGAEAGPIVGGEFSWPQIINWQIIRPIAYYLFFGIPVLAASLGLFIWLIQKTMTWYRLGRKILLAFWGVLLFLVLTQALLAYPLANLLFFPMIYHFSWRMAVSWLPGLILVLMMAALFYHYHHQFAYGCPKCGQRIPDDFSPGQDCPYCYYPLHPWLNTPYL